MDKNKSEKLSKFIEDISKEYINTKNNKDELLKSYYKTLQEIYFDSDFRHLYSEIYEKLSYLDLLTRENDVSSMIYINENINLIYKYIEKEIELNSKQDENQNQKQKDFLSKIKKLYDHLSLDTSRILHMRNIDKKTEDNKKDLLDSLNQKEKELKNSISKYSQKVENIDEEAMKKMGMYISVFTLIAGNIAVLFKGVEVSPFQLGGLVLIINSVLIISIRTLFYFVNKDKRVSKDTIVGCSIGIFLGLSLFFTSILFKENTIQKKVKNEITAEYNTKIEKINNELSETKKELEMLELKNELLNENLNKTKKENDKKIKIY